MNDKDSSNSGMHPLATAVALALAGTLAGCASTPRADGSPVAQAKAAYAQQNYGQAAQLLTGPAEKGDPEAQYALGYLYYYGQGVPRDLYRAKSWFETAAQLGNFEAKRALITLRTYGKLPREAKATAAAASASAPAPVPPAAAAPPPMAAPTVSAAPAETASAPAASTTAVATPEASAPARAPAPAPVAPPIAATAAPTPSVAPAAPAATASAAPEGPKPAAPEPAVPVVSAPVPVEPAPVAEAPAPAPELPAKAAPAPVSDPAPAAPPAEPHSDAAMARSGVAAAPVARATGPAAPRTECAPAQAAAPAPARPDSGSTTARAPAPEPAPRDDSPDDLPDSPVVIMGKEEGKGPAGTRAVALRRAAPAPVTLVPGSEQAAPIIRKAPAPITIKNGKRYTIHLLSSPSKEELLHTVRAFGLADAAWYPVHQVGGVQYRLIYGGYETLAEARAAMHRLPEALFARSPWINNYPESVTVTAFNGVPTARVAAVEPGILR